VARVPLVAAGDGATARWTASRASGAALAPGVYFARVPGERIRRLVVVGS